MENYKYSDIVEKQTIFQKLNSTFTLEYKGEKIDAIKNINYVKTTYMGPNSPYILLGSKGKQEHHLYNVKTKEVMPLNNDQNFLIRTERIIPADHEYGREEKTIIDEHGIVFNNNGNVVFISPSVRGSKIYEEGKNVKKNSLFKSF